GAHQDPQYNVLYRNINMVRSYVDAAESKKIMAWADINQIDGAHNANATARDAWKVMPELLVQHGINSRFSEKVGMKPSNISLSTVPPTAAPIPTMRYDLPYALALRQFFDRYKMRAQMNTKYITSSSREATVTHVMNMLISRLTSADIQSTITPDEGRNVPWHMFNIEACDTAKQSLVGMDGLLEMVELRKDGYLPAKAREIQERAVLYLEEMIQMGGYYEAVERGMFVDSGEYPERNGDGIPRDIQGGIGAGTVYERAENYMAPVTSHYGYNNTMQYGVDPEKASELIGGCSFEDRSKIQYIDELDPVDNVETRLAEKEAYRNTNMVMPEVEWLADGTVQLELLLPVPMQVAKYAALEYAKHMNMKDAEVIHLECMHPSEGTRVQLKGKIDFAVDLTTLEIPPEPKIYSDQELWSELEAHPMRVIAGTVGEDEHSVGLREIIDIKHGGIEKWGFNVEYLGTSVPIQKLVDAAIEMEADAIMASTIISHDDIHYKNMQKLNDYAIEKGVRDKLVILAGGTQVTPELAVEHGMDAGFGRGTKGVHVATAIVQGKRRMRGEDE
ncbi:MAG: LuxR family transcriptional regulator, partial [Tissierellia bacterium]|nr:LuxR family transcriptional regulator [Tissierellia bacterium]